MKKMKTILNCVITLILVVGVIYQLGVLVRPTNTDSACRAVKAFHDMPEHSMEVIGYGSSHIWRGLNVMEMYEKYGIGAYNYGCNWQRINTTEFFLKDSLRTQSPKVALIETFRVNELMQDEDMNGEIYYTRGISTFDGKQRYLKQCFGDDKERYLSYYMPLCAFHENWINLEHESFLSNSNIKEFYNTMGYMYTADVVSISIPDESTFKQEKLSEAATESLDEMVSACKEKHVSIVFITVPYQGDYAYGDAMTEYAEKNGCEYFNLYEYIDELGIDETKNFSDEGHLNNNGAVKVADFLGEYLISNYDLSDMRTIKDNPWDRALGL